MKGMPLRGAQGEAGSKLQFRENQPAVGPQMAGSGHRSRCKNVRTEKDVWERSKATEITGPLIQM
jgi:hypothetical protein